MVLNTYSALQKLADKVADMSNFPLLSCEYGDIVRKWDSAKYLCKIQNKCLKDGNPNDIVKSYTVMDEDLQTLVTVNVRAKKSFTKMQWFMLEIANEQYLTSQQIRQLLASSAEKV